MQHQLFIPKVVLRDGANHSEPEPSIIEAGCTEKEASECQKGGIRNAAVVGMLIFILIIYKHFLYSPQASLLFGDSIIKQIAIFVNTLLLYLRY